MVINKTMKRGDKMVHKAHVDAVKWAKGVIEADCLVFDTETSGTRGSDEIVDIAVVNSKGEVKFNSLIQPLNPIPVEATRVHGITNQDVAGAPFWPEVYSELYRLFQEYTVVLVYNLPFDVRLFNQTSGQYGLRKLPFPEMKGYEWHCAMRKYSEYNGVWSQRFNNYRSVKLSEAAQQFSIETPDNLHRALTDAKLTLDVVKAMADTSIQEEFV